METAQLQSNDIPPHKNHSPFFCSQGSWALRHLDVTKRTWALEANGQGSLTSHRNLKQGNFIEPWHLHLYNGGSRCHLLGMAGEEGGSLSQHLAQNPENSRLSPSTLPHPLNPKELYPWNLPGNYEILHPQPIKMSEFLRSAVMKKKRKITSELTF